MCITAENPSIVRQNITRIRDFLLKARFSYATAKNRFPQLLIKSYNELMLK